MNTKYQYTNLHSFDDGSFLTVALLEEENWVGICYVPFNASGYPSGVKNPSYEHWREGLPYDGEGYFYNFWDYFTCTIVNGQPVVEAR